MDISKVNGFSILSKGSQAFWNEGKLSLEACTIEFDEYNNDMFDPL